MLKISEKQRFLELGKVYLAITKDSIDLSPGSEVVLRHQTWTDYEAMLTSRQDNAGIKIYFDGCTQEIHLMAPLPEHGNKSDTLTDLVKVLLRKQGKDWHCFDPITLKRQGLKGIEPDTCFYIDNREAILGKSQIDLEFDPPPDLAIEIDGTSLTKPTDYADIKVPELWIYRDRTLSIYLWVDDQYQSSTVSEIFPNIPVIELLPHYIEMAWKEGSSVAIRKFEEAINQTN
jgi:Uma2 family endonuclease